MKRKCISRQSWWFHSLNDEKSFVNTRLTVEVQSLTVVCHVEGESLAGACFENFALGVATREDKFELKAHLSNIVVVDMESTAMRRQVVSMEGPDDLRHASRQA